MAETSGLLNRRTGITGTEGSNPSVSATFLKTRNYSYRRGRPVGGAPRIAHPVTAPAFPLAEAAPSLRAPSAGGLAEMVPSIGSGMLALLDEDC